jgi:hypothetical protein
MKQIATRDETRTRPVYREAKEDRKRRERCAAPPSAARRRA